ncbi:hypothetical protein VB151_19070 [Xanthomonas fragariae]|uniref:Secreted protein n=1 Tax=Xanthomonas fragariae TaxID=48664 RepID=A0A1Y6H648_9XANT|nr:hypothetical protein [Xanthomonas fragariae]AOD14732.1 hypothetical protein BER92_08275 [Xanthomonas fragariae]AOD18126.1 hypothetical protein BER93_08300 [Xanthomonas fragariae]ENZ96336.1 hypothetical protein O1K_04841 [Xanthomonas fragariae LMG 25863]MBL9195862.1 hypothetical protein [Xanthomonas fragariae]MBL9220629.1 hypothetical protein [Xanthomonas fragariae]
MLLRLFHSLLVCLFALTAWSAANAHTRIHDAFVGEGMAVMVDAGEQRDAADNLQDDADAQTEVDTHPADDIPLLSQAWLMFAWYSPCWYAHYAPASQKRDLIPQLRPPNALRA